MSCKYVTVDSLIAYRLIEVLYGALEELSGGLAHIVTDDHNFDDESLQIVINSCKRGENKDRKDSNTCIILCEALLRLTLEQRYFIFSIIENGTTSMYEGIDILCNHCCMNDSKTCINTCPYKETFDMYVRERSCLVEDDIK